MREISRNGRIAAVPRIVRNDFCAPRRVQRSYFVRVMRRLMPCRPTDAIALLVVVMATLAVLVNALMLQRPPHSAPTITGAQDSGASTNRNAATRKGATAATPATPARTPIPPLRPESAAVQARAQLVLDIQRELTARGHYDGAVDGRPGPRTDQAIRDFERSQGIPITGEPSGELLDRVRRAGAKSDITGSLPPVSGSPGSIRVLNVQRVLARLGYGPLRLTGMHDPDTRASIERFERDRGLSLSGDITDRLIRELAAVSGAPTP